MQYDLVTEIAAVTVYPDRALVVRTGAVEIAEPGEHALRIGGLPLYTQADSMRAMGRGPAETRILGIEASAEFHTTPPEERRHALEEDIRRLERELARQEDRRQIAEEQREWLRSLAEHAARSFAWGMTRGTTKPEDAGAFFAYAAEEAQRAATARQAIDGERDDVARQLEARRREYEQLGQGRQPDRLAATVRIALTRPGRVEIELAYLTSGATWRPRYDARVDAEHGDILLTQQAVISQQAGEDWMHVALTLSTARPAATQRLPDDPLPWYVGVYEPPRPVAPSAMEEPAQTFAGARRYGMSTQTVHRMMSSASLDLVGAELAPAEAERSGSVQLFHVAGGGDVPSDGAPHIFTLGEYNLPASMDYVAMPEVAVGAQRRARGRNVTGQVLLPGSLHVFAAGPAADEYIGSSTLELTAENADLALYLGVDDNVTVKKELVERNTDKGSLLQSGIRRITFGYRVTVGNRTGARQRIVVKDRLPVPRHERIKVKVLDVKPQPVEHTRLEQLTWELDVAAGEELRVEWRFVVESPAELELIGLE